MKKIKIVFFVLVSCILAALFFASCGDGEEEEKKPDSEGVTYTLVIKDGTATTAPTLTAATIERGGTRSISRTLSASDGSSTVGIQVTYACTTHSDCLITVNAAGTTISVPAAAELGDHAFTATATKDGKSLATASFTITVTETSFALSIETPIAAIKHLDDPTIINYTLTAPGGDLTGITLAVAPCSVHPSCTVQINWNSPRRRFDVPSIPATAAVATHTFRAAATKNGAEVANATFSFDVLAKYTLTTQNVTAARGSTITLTYNLTKSDGTSTEGTTVGFYCTSDYDFCDLLNNIPGRVWTDMLVPVPSSGPSIKTHSMKMQAEDAAYKVLADTTFTFGVTN